VSRLLAEADQAPRGRIVGAGVGDELHQKFVNDGFQLWLDEVDLIPGQDWDVTIDENNRAPQRGV